MKKIKYTIIGYYSLPPEHYDGAETDEDDVRVDQSGVDQGVLIAEDFISFSDEDPQIFLELVEVDE